MTRANILNYDRRDVDIMRGVYDLLIASVPKAVAKYGIDELSTRKLAAVADVGDSNMYRFFSSMDELLLTVYSRRISELTVMVIRSVDRLRADNQGKQLYECARIVFNKVWRYFVEDPDLCLFYVYYYYSSKLNAQAIAVQQAQVEELVNHVDWLFFNRDDAERCIDNAFSLILSSARLVVIGNRPDSEETATRTFSDVYNMLFSMSNRWPFRLMGT